MRIAAPQGRVTVRLEYAVEAVDWLARGAALVGLVLLGAIVWRRPTRKYGDA